MRRLLPLVVLALLLASCSRTPSPTVFVDPALAVLVPPDSVALAGVRMQQLAKTTFYKDWVLKRRIAMFEEFRRRSGIDVTRDIWELLLAWDGKNAVSLVRGKFSAQGEEPRLDVPGARRFAYGGSILIGSDEFAVAFLNPTTAVAGPTDAVKRVLDRRNQVTGLPAALKGRVEAIPSSNQAWFVANVAGQIPGVERGPGGPAAAVLQMLRNVQVATGTFDLRQSVRSNVTLEATGEAEAEQLRGGLRALLGLGRLNTAEDRREMLSVFDAMQIAREKNVVRFSADIPFDLLEKAAVQFPTFGGR